MTITPNNYGEPAPIRDYAAAVAKYGETLGTPVPPGRIERVLDAIAVDAADVFGSTKAARRFLDQSPIDRGMSARAVAKDIGISRILSRIDGLRFGAFA